MNLFWVHVDKKASSSASLTYLDAVSSIYSPAYRRFLRRLREARTEAKLSQRQAATRLRKPQSYVSKCETGERRVDVIELQGFARLYSLPITWFLGD